MKGSDVCKKGQESESGKEYDRQEAISSHYPPHKVSLHIVIESFLAHNYFVFHSYEKYFRVILTYPHPGQQYVPGIALQLTCI